MKRIRHVKNTSFWFKFGKREFDIRSIQKVSNKKFEFAKYPELTKVCSFIKTIKDFDALIDLAEEFEMKRQESWPNPPSYDYIDDGGYIHF